MFLSSQRRKTYQRFNSKLILLFTIIFSYRINNVLDNIPKRIARSEQNLQTVESQLEDAKVEVQKPFSKEADLKEKNERLSELNALLNMDETNSPVIEEEQIEEQQIVEGINKLQSRDNVPKFGTR